MVLKREREREDCNKWCHKRSTLKKNSDRSERRKPCEKLSLQNSRKEARTSIKNFSSCDFIIDILYVVPTKKISS